MGHTTIAPQEEVGLAVQVHFVNLLAILVDEKQPLLIRPAGLHRFVVL